MASTSEKTADQTQTATSNIIEEKVIVENIGIHCVRCGNGDKAVLLMPGAIGSTRTDFQPQINKLPSLLPGYTVVAWDPPGYGQSRPPKRKFPTDFLEIDAAFAHKLMHKLGFERYAVMGFSDGGITAIILAANYPQAVEKMIIWGVNAYATDDEVKMYNSRCCSAVHYHFFSWQSIDFVFLISKNKKYNYRY